MKRRVSLVAVMLLLAVLLVSTGPASTSAGDPAVAGLDVPNSVIAFSSQNRNGPTGWDLWTLDPNAQVDSDNPVVVQVTDRPDQPSFPPGDEWYPVWSHDGSRIAFSRNDGSVWVVGADGSADPTQVGKPGPHPTVIWFWSQGDESIYFVRAGTGLHYVAGDGSDVNADKIVAGAGSVCQPDPSPDHAQLVFRTCGTNGPLKTVGFNASETALVGDPEPLYPLPGEDACAMPPWPSTTREVVGPSWAPDDSAIAFGRDTSNFLRNPYTISPDGTGCWAVTDEGWFSARRPRWSPDSEWLVFRVGAGDSDLYLARPDGTEVVALTTDAFPDDHPDWSPALDDDCPDPRPTADSWIAYKPLQNSDLSPNESIWIMDPDDPSSTGYRLTCPDPGQSDIHARWSPDGSRVAFSRKQSGNTQTSIWVAYLDGTEERQVLGWDSRGGGETAPAFWYDGDSDGERVYYIRDPGGSCSFNWIYADQVTAPSDANPVTGAEHKCQPDISPDGTQVALREYGQNVAIEIGDFDPMAESPDDAVTDIRVHVPASRGHELIEPMWSPDGTKILFVVGGDAAYWVPVPFPGGVYEEQQVTPAYSAIGGQSWSPDADRIVYWARGASTGGDNDILLQASDGTGVPAPWRSNDIYEYSYDWSPARNQPPSVDAGGPYEGDEGAAIALNGAAATDPDTDPLTLSWTVDAPLMCSFDDDSALNPDLICDDDGTYTVTLTADDDTTTPISDDTTVDVFNVAPTATFGSEGPVDEGTSFNLELAAPFDPSSADITAGFTYAFDCGDGSGYGAFSASSTASCSTDDGAEVRNVKAKIRDKDFDETEYTDTVDVFNVAPTATFGNEGPVDEGTSFNLELAAPFDPSSADITAGFTYAFDCGDGSGYGAYSASSTASCSTDDNALRSVKGQIKDKDGGLTEYVALVPVDNVAPTITAVTGPGGPVPIGDQPITVEVAWADPGSADTHEVTWDWGDLDTDTQLATSPASLGHSYAEPGVYVVTATVEDDDGGIDTETFEFVVIYDPSGGFVTGGGWIDSPAGAYVAEPTLTGKANFGFVSKYKNGASTPSGNTELQFNAGDLNFHSDSYDWLVIAGFDRAKYKGVGTVNGSGSYGFMLTAVDNGNSGDTFRIKIWDTDAGDAVVYDNKIGTGDGSYDGTVIGGGNIKVHKQ